MNEAFTVSDDRLTSLLSRKSDAQETTLVLNKNML
jgi:hypothetical protein